MKMNDTGPIVLYSTVLSGMTIESEAGITIYGQVIAEARSCRPIAQATLMYARCLYL